MSPLPVSVYIITLNEQADIGRLLDRLTAFDEVIVVDSGSTDRTVAIADSYANVTTSYRQWSGFSDQKNHALSLCRNEWVLNLDADEEPGPGFLEAVADLVDSNDADALETPRILYRRGRIPRNFFRDDMLIRFFRKSCGYYEPARVHEKITINGRIKTSDALLLHYENLTYSRRIEKSNQYSQLKAEDKFARGKRCNVFILLFIFPWSFIQCYLFKGCFLDGCEGILTSMNHACYNFMKYAKLWELEQAERPRAANREPRKSPVMANPAP